MNQGPLRVRGAVRSLPLTRLRAAAQGRLLAAAVGAIAIAACDSTSSPAPLLGVAPSNPSVQVGQTVQLFAVNATGFVAWSSSDSQTAIVLQGLVTGVGAGTARVTATVGGDTASAIVSVAPASTLITLAANVQPIFSASCVGCHSPSRPIAGVDLSTADASRASLVNVPAVLVTSVRVLPGDTTNSFLYQEVTATGTDTAGWMPLGCRPGNGVCLDPSLVRIIVQWIEQGAH